MPAVLTPCWASQVHSSSIHRRLARLVIAERVTTRVVPETPRTRSERRRRRKRLIERGDHLLGTFTSRMRCQRRWCVRGRGVSRVGHQRGKLQADERSRPSARLGFNRRSAAHAKLSDACTRSSTVRAVGDGIRPALAGSRRLRRCRSACPGGSTARLTEVNATDRAYHLGGMVEAPRGQCRCRSQRGSRLLARATVTIQAKRALVTA
jgi:hypothetical protein